MVRSKKKPLASFEQSLATLESIVIELEKGDISLDDALSQFEAGVVLVRNCQALLDTAEQKIQLLLLKDKPDNSELVSFMLDTEKP